MANEVMDILHDLIVRKLGDPESITGNENNFLCPFCEKLGQTHHLHVNFDKDDGVAICHSCEYKTRDLKFLVRDLYGGLPKNLARLVARAQLGMDIAAFFKKSEAVKKAQGLVDISLPDKFRRLPYKGSGVASRLRRYLEGRGFPYADIDRYGLGYIDDPRHIAYGYVIFPFYMHSRLVYWQGRRVCPDKSHFRGPPPKNYNPPGTAKRSILYGYDIAVMQKQGVVVEGPLDTIGSGLGGMGLTSKTLHVEQIRLLALSDFEEIVVCLDADTWDNMICAFRDAKGNTAKEGKKFPRPLAYAYELKRAASSRIGVLRLPSNDPAKHRKRMPRFLNKCVKWLDNDFVSQIEGMLK